MYRDKNKVTNLTLADVVSMLETNDSFVQASLVALYNRQTALEASADVTIDLNKVGMQQADAKLFSRFARKIMSGNSLSVDELAAARKLWNRPRVPIATICKYRRQILAMIEEAAKARVGA